ncbi:MAG TPA: ATP phosphoribosyltransferase regulatory subunit [Burkholderiaceae bacterium]|nr:ATP phosphoribosyltransferase regulatory subunit [Burkholderiaceae bacterium]
MTKWLLPEHIADILPAEARQIEDLRRRLLDVYRAYGYELVFPPLLEYVDSLLTGTGRDLDLHTLKVVDQLSGRTLGLRADITPQVARIDAHLLNRDGVVRLCYAGSTVHAMPRGIASTREPFQVGAELYGHAGPEADQEIAELAFASAAIAGLRDVRIDLSHVGVFGALLDRASVGQERYDEIVGLVLAKDVPALREYERLEPATRAALVSLCGLYGGVEVLAKTREVFARFKAVLSAIDELEALVKVLPSAQVTIDLAELHGIQYHSGITFAVYCAGAPNAVIRGGRYDEVGRAFGRARPATGFSVDLRDIASLMELPAPRPAIRAPWADDAQLRSLIKQLREQGEVVVQDLPHHEDQRNEFACDRAITKTADGWAVVQPVSK